MTTISLNGATHQLDPGATLVELLSLMGQSPQSLATAVNGEFVAREARGERILRDGDVVFTFQPITGG